ncbi:seryl-tRNA synthetase [Vararia minispora EC-137]|uniref:Seryl-tRNA synthetase n=1 Tax=Vararia minispora EC-137 TaxID=1314806 RepID=A0ACB8QRL1_9AGAM|nr:seryl-tRNA synthetase [Vararia minispora EC-137]
MHRGLRATVHLLTAPRLGVKPSRPILDYRGIAENAEAKSQNIIKRNSKLPDDTIPRIVALHHQFATLTTEVNAKRSLQSTISDRVRDAKTDDARTAARAEATLLKGELKGLQAKLDAVHEDLLNLAILVPNDAHPDVPVGPEENAVTLSTHGPPPTPADRARDHMAIAGALDLVDGEAGAMAAGSSFYFLRNEAALLELALVSYALSIATKHGFTFVTTPDVVYANNAVRCGFHHRDAATQTYHIETKPDSPKLVLAGTAEIPLAAMFGRQVIPKKDLPKLFVGLGHAFRAEAGAKGAEAHGLYRVHQFTKLELFAVTTPEQSESMFERMKGVQLEIFSGLGFPFRVLDMPTEQLGAPAYRKYDVEAWMPGRGAWGEISSASNCTDYQARRFHIKCYSTPKPGEHLYSFAHTLNGTAAAVPRLIIALLENGARFEGETVVGLDLPEVLRPYWVHNPARDIIHWV